MNPQPILQLKRLGCDAGAFGRVCFIMATLLIPAPLIADTFGSGAHEFMMEFVTVTNGTTPDTSGFGAVGSDYRIGKHEVSTRMIDACNALSGGPAITRSSRDPNKPATSITWNEAARFVNWLNEQGGYCAAYKFPTNGANDDIALWAPGDAGYDPANPFRNSNACYFLPSEDEWYRAAFYDPGAGVYWDYATGSDLRPTAVAGGTAPGTAVYDQSSLAGPADVTNAGGLSPFGTMAQSGNVFEWMESNLSPPNDTVNAPRVNRGGFWNDNRSRQLGASSRVGVYPKTTGSAVGFRVASAIELPTMVLKLNSLSKNADTVRADITSTCGNVDVYRSVNLLNWSGPIATDLAAGVGVVLDSAAPVGRAFYVLVLHGSPALPK